MIKRLFFIFIVLTCHAFQGCRTDIDRIRQPVGFLESELPILQIGSDDEIKKPGNYDLILTYCVDDDENIYVSDISNFKVDKFDKEGNYLFSFGGISHQASRYPGWSETISVDSKGNLIAYSIARHKFLIFSFDGKESRTNDFSRKLKKWYIRKIKADEGSNVFLLGYSEKTGYQLLKYNLETKEYLVIHTDNQRIRPFFKDLGPDFAVDKTGNIYITDTIDYQIFKYSNNGRLMDKFFKKVNRIKMTDLDFSIQVRRGRIQKIPNYKDLWKKLKGKSGYFPAVFGINIDENRLFAWTSNRDPDKKYLVEVYDLDFKYLCTTSYYNIMGSNLAVIRNQRLYIPDIGSDNMELKTAVGRFGYFNIPYKIEVFRISEKVLKK